MGRDSPPSALILIGVGAVVEETLWLSPVGWFLAKTAGKWSSASTAGKCLLSRSIASSIRPDSIWTRISIMEQVSSCQPNETAIQPCLSLICSIMASAPPIINELPSIFDPDGISSPSASSFLTGFDSRLNAAAVRV